MAQAFSLSMPNENLAIDLSRALARLEKKILASPQNSRLYYSRSERAKTATNLEYARGLLLRLEHESSSIKIQSRKQAAQTKLFSQRALLKTLTDRLQELNRQDESDASSSEDLRDNASITIIGPRTSSPPLPSPIRKDFPEPLLRNRLNPLPKTAQGAPFPPSTTPLFDSASEAQAALTTSLLSLATTLKQSSLAFSSSLIADTEVLTRASEGLDRNFGGMDVAGKRMGTLRRMTEGTGWWGRMMFYAWIAALWVLALMLVFMMPKLRF